MAYHICDQYPSSYNTELPKWTRVEAYGRFTELPNVVHVMGCERAGQYRGVPYLAPIIEQVLQLKRYSDAEVTAAVIQSFFTSFITNPSVAGDFSLSEAVPDEEDEASYASSDYEMGPGSIIELKPGQDVRFADPTRPSGRYTDFVGTVCEEIGAALGLPCELLLKRFNASYSASRAALLEAGKMFATRRKWFANTFCNPIYAVWLSEAVALGRIKAPGFFTDPLRRAAWLGASWVGPSQGQIDPVKEINSELAAINEGITTREQATIRLNGGSWTANMEQLAREEALLRSIRKEDKQIQSDFKPENEEEEQDDEKGGEEDARSKTKTEQ